MPENESVTNWVLGVAGAIAGGLLGYFAFFLLARQGLYAMVLPGALLGLGCGSLSGIKSNVLGIVSGLLAVLLAVFTEWRFAPFVDDGSFGYFISHVHNLKSMTLIMIAVGGLFSFWFGRGREGGVWIRRSKNGTGD